MPQSKDAEVYLQRTSVPQDTHQGFGMGNLSKPQVQGPPAQAPSRRVLAKSQLHWLGNQSCIQNARSRGTEHLFNPMC